MFRFLLISAALFAVALATGYGGHDDGGHGYGHEEMHHHTTVIHKPIYKTSYIPKTVKTHETHHSQPVSEHKFTHSHYETPGATYAIPATKTYTITRPGYTTYKHSSITKTHVTKHVVPGPTISKPIIGKVVKKVLVPVHKEEYGHQQSYGHNGGDMGSYGGGDMGMSGGYGMDGGDMGSYGGSHY